MIHFQDRWAVVTGASSGLGRGLAARLADKGMSVVLTGRNAARLNEVAEQIRRTSPGVQVETVAADLSTYSGVSALLDHVGDRPIEVLVNNAGFGSYGPFAEADAAREADEVAVDVNAVITLARAFLPQMIARGSGGILNVASTIAFQPAPYQAVYGASKALVLSFSQALWAEARKAGVAVTALCPGPTRTGFVDALGADVGHTAIYRFMPHEWLTRVSARLLGPAGKVPRPPIEVRNEVVIAAPPERVWELLSDVRNWPSWHRACRWVRIESSAGAGSFRWKAHPIALRTTVVENHRPDSFAFTADARGLHAEHGFTIRPTPDGKGTVVVSNETQVGPLPRLGRAFLARHLRRANQEWLTDLAIAARERAATPGAS